MPRRGWVLFRHDPWQPSRSAISRVAFVADNVSVTIAYPAQFEGQRTQVADATLPWLASVLRSWYLHTCLPNCCKHSLRVLSVAKPIVDLLRKCKKRPYSNVRCVLFCSLTHVPRSRARTPVPRLVCCAQVRAAREFPNDLVRLSIGIESPEDLIADLTQAMQSYTALGPSAAAKAAAATGQ